MPQSPTLPGITRRHALQGLLAAGVAPWIVPAGIARGEPSDTLRIGVIGAGRMGRTNTKQAVYEGLKTQARVVAVCDVDAARARAGKRMVEEIYQKRLGENGYQAVQTYGDYRELIAQADLDGVIIATPDFWHALPAIAAAKAGLGIFLQKPATHTIPEGRALVQAVQGNGVTFQTGSQQRSSVYFRRACEAVRNNRLGKLKRIEVTLPKDSGQGQAKSMRVPDNLDYDFWLGPTQQLPYTEDRVHPRRGFGRPGWLQIEHYSRGMITGWGSHMFDIAQWGLGVDQTGAPTRVKASAEFPDRGLFNVHTQFNAEAEYPNGVLMSAASGQPAGVKFIGEDGWIHVQRGSFEAHDRQVLREVDESEKRLYRSETHMGNFLKCLRTDERTAAPVEVGHRSNSVCVIHHIAMRLNRPLQWDPDRERFIDDAEANALLDYPHREPWTL
jgi:predicted dehydrogenase